MRSVRLALVALIVLLCARSAFGKAGTISVSPTIWNAGAVVVNSMNSGTIIVTNTGSVAVTLNTITVSGGSGSNSSEFAICCISLPVAVPAKGTASFKVMFSPTIGGGASGTLSVQSTATNVPTVSLSGTGVHDVDLYWTASTSATNPCYANLGYRIKVSSVSGGPYATIGNVPGTFYPDYNVQAGNTYYHVVTTVADYVHGSSCSYPSETELESVPSNEVSATIPRP